MLEENISTNKRLASPEAPGSAWAPLLLSSVTAVALGRSFLNLQAPRNSEHHRWSPTLGWTEGNRQREQQGFFLLAADGMCLFSQERPTELMYGQH